MNNNKYVVFIWLGVALLLFLFFFLDYKKKQSRKNNAKYVFGQIVNFGKRAKGEKYIAYEFMVNGETYYGTVDIKYCNSCSGSCCEIGSSVKVRYDNDDPTNNDLIRME